MSGGDAAINLVECGSPCLSVSCDDDSGGNMLALDVTGCLPRG